MSTPPVMSPSPVSGVLQSQLHALVKLALEEDVAHGDITSLSTIPTTSQSSARFLAKQAGYISGIAVATEVFRLIDARIHVEWYISDGDAVQDRQVFGAVKGSTHNLLIAERLVLNIMQRMAGITTKTREYVSAISVAGGHSILLDTRKTVPGLRQLDKMAVRLGGAQNHRVGLYDQVLIKDNHIAASGSVSNALKNTHDYLKSHGKEGMFVEIECRTLDELREAISCHYDRSLRIDRILLDNMVTMRDGVVDASMLEQALDIMKKSERHSTPRISSEASGNVSLLSVGVISRTGVDYISCGALTHSVHAMDISMKIVQV